MDIPIVISNCPHYYPHHFAGKNAFMQKSYTVYTVDCDFFGANTTKYARNR